MSEPLWTEHGGRRLIGGYADDGYAFMAEGAKRGWKPVASWGRDGWDLGDWPIVVYLFRDASDGRFERACYVEGDIAIDAFASAEERDRNTDAAALHWWQVQEAEWVAGIETVDQMPDRLRGRFTAARLEAA